ncbi:sensor histidine kinase [Planomicrobium sp. YIM 101495]|nr:sensor histidine kinase [Planomicrobium sp. YIM 101495]
MKSWIACFLLLLLTVDVLLWIDPGLSVTLSSALYLNGLLLFGFAVFLYWRYRKETVYVKQLESLLEEMPDDWYEALPEGVYRRDEAVNEMLVETSRSQAEKVNELRRETVVQGDYIAAWVHEAKAPLTAMKLILDANRELPAMRRIDSEWLRLHLLIDQQLYISRLPSLETDYALEVVEVKSVVSPEVRELMAWCREKNIAIEMDDLDSSVTTDRKWARFVVRQILTNAVKYTAEGGTITITAAETEAGRIVLSISDEGPGIAPHDMPRIFDKGFTGSTGRIQNAATGLGLYLAKTVSERIGIRLAAHSDPPGGTTMEMVFSHSNEFDRIRK